MQELVPQIAIDEAEDATRRARFPAGSAIEFADLELDSRVDALDRLREAEPISWVPALGGWLVTSHALARELLSRRDEFTVWAEPNLVRASLGVMMLSTDGDEHARQRRPFEEPFGVRPVPAVSVAIIGTIVIWYAFYKLLRVPLPWGVLQRFAF